MFKVISCMEGDLGYVLSNSREILVSVELANTITLLVADKERVSPFASTAEKYYRANLKEDCHRAFQSILNIFGKTNMPSSAAKYYPEACTVEYCACEYVALTLLGQPENEREHKKGGGADFLF